MKKIKLLLLLLMLGTASAYSQLQQIKIVSFTVKNQLPAVIDNWGNTPGSLLLVAQLPPNVQVKGIRLMVQIKGGGAIICGNNSAGGMQVDEFTTRTFSANELTSTLQSCHDLKEGSYSICVQFYNVDRVAISNEVCKEFSVEASKDIEYNPPTLINPENGKVFTEAELSRPVTFRWTPLVPKPRDPVTYRLKVWQLMQGQNSTEAMRTNQPIIVKDVDNITQAVVNAIYTGPCRPPYLCDYVWQVQALNREGKPMGKNEGKSESYTFKVETTTTNSTPPQLVAPNDAKAFTANEMSAPVTFRWTPVVPKPQSVIYRLKVWQLMQGQTGSQAMRTNQPIVTKDVDNITQAVVSGIYTGPCRPPYLCDYVWQVQAVDREDHPIGSNEGKSELWSFKVGENNSSTIQNVFPEDKKQFAPDDAKNNISFRWTPLVPKPQEPLVYRLKVWQLMQGQSGSQAMRTNKPIITKDVDNITEATVSNIYNGPCKPPYLCDFIWVVEATTKNSTGASQVLATSQPTMFFVSQYIIQIDSIKVSCTDKPGVYVFSYSITNPNPGPATLNLFTVTSSVPAGAILGSFTPPINTVIPAGNQLTITGTINAPPNLSNICIGAEIKDVGNAFWKASKDTCTKVDPCKCDICENVKINIVQKDLKFDANGNIILNTSISASPKPVKNIKAELVYFEYKPESDECMLCNKDSYTYGNFNTGNHTMEWNFAPPKNIAGGTDANMIINVPPTVGCCNAGIKWCIRYIITFDDCTVCNKLVCYELRKEGCSSKTSNPNNQK